MAIWENTSLLQESESNNTSTPRPLSSLSTGKDIVITCFKASYSFKTSEGLSQLVSLLLQLYAFSDNIE